MFKISKYCCRFKVAVYLSKLIDETIKSVNTSTAVYDGSIADLKHDDCNVTTEAHWWASLDAIKYTNCTVATEAPFLPKMYGEVFFSLLHFFLLHFFGKPPQILYSVRFAFVFKIKQQWYPALGFHLQLPDLLYLLCNLLIEHAQSIKVRVNLGHDLAYFEARYSIFWYGKIAQ